jgi:hypothetical protein
MDSLDRSQASVLLGSLSAIPRLLSHPTLPVTVPAVFGSRSSAADAFMDIIDLLLLHSTVASFILRYNSKPS